MNPSIQTLQGACFRLSLPTGWRVTEDGQFAVIRVAPDQNAVLGMVGNAGLPEHTPPLQFAMEKFSQAGMQHIQPGPHRNAPPLPGFGFAWEFEFHYQVGGAPCFGTCRVSMAPNYGFTTIAITWAASVAPQWGYYQGWLPQVAHQIEILNGQAFGARGIAHQNLQNSIAVGQQAQANRDWAERQWAEVTRQRGESNDRQHAQFRENLGNVQTWTNPYGYPNLQLPNTYRHYWINPQGQIIGSNDPNHNPNHHPSSGGNWSPMGPLQQP